MERGSNEEAEKHPVETECPSPEHAAEDYFNRFIENRGHGAEGGFPKLLADIRTLQLPGEVFMSKKTRTKKSTYLSPDERGERESSMELTDHTLTVGARKQEWTPTSSWNQGKYGDEGKKIYVAVTSGAHGEVPEGTPEQIRDRLLAQKRQLLKAMFEEYEAYGLPSKKSKGASSDPNDDIRYKARWNELQKALQHQWDEEEIQFLTENKRSWEEYEDVANDLRDARKKAAEAEEAVRAAKKQVNFSYERFTRPHDGNIGSDSIEMMHDQATALRSYAEKINACLSTQLEKKQTDVKNESRVEEEVDSETIKTSAEAEQSEESRKLLAIARSLAEIAEQKLGFATAKILFQNVSVAGYGRARRQDDIKRALGDLSEEARRFYELSRASDVNNVLDNTLSILEGGNKHEVSEHSREIPQQETRKEELPRLKDADKKGWWNHELPNGFRHSEKLSKTDKALYDTGDRIEVHCPSCPGNPLIGYLQKQSV
jgi:hypothetical protein